MLDEKSPGTSDDDVWHLNCKQGYVITYQIISDPLYPDDFVCIFRNVGMIPPDDLDKR